MISEIIGPNLATLQAASTQVRALLREIGSENDLSLAQALTLYAAATALKPDLILDLGTGNGNSAAVFALYSQTARARPRILTFDLTSHWQQTVDSRLQKFAYLGKAVEPVIGDLTKFNFFDAIESAHSVLVFWDCHGYQIAETILSSIFPAIQTKENLVLCHDIADVRYANFGFNATNYAGSLMWSGMDEWYRRHTGPLRIGPFFGIVDQLISLTDFTSRNQIELGSCDHEIETKLAPDQKKIWHEFAGSNVSMCWLSLESDRFYYFPPPPVILHPRAIFETNAQEYAQTFYNIGVELAGETIEVTASDQHLASLWITLEGRSVSGVSLNLTWNDTGGKRAPVTIQDFEFREIDQAGSRPPPEKVRVLIHPKVPGRYALPSRVELVARP